MKTLYDYCKFVWRQLHGWSTSSYALWTFGLGIELMVYFSQPINWVSTVTCLATLLSMGCVISITNVRQINGWLGLLSAIGFIAIALANHHYMNIAIQLGYCASLDIPVLLNSNWNKGAEKYIKGLSLKQWGITLLGTALIWLIVSLIMMRVPSESLPIIDSLTFAVSFVGGVLCCCHVKSQFYFWTFGSITEVILWALSVKAGHADVGMAMNYVVFLLNDAMAFLHSSWFNKKIRRNAIKQEEQED